jgi:hypothetical protein
MKTKEQYNKQHAWLVEQQADAQKELARLTEEMMVLQDEPRYESTLAGQIRKAEEETIEGITHELRALHDVTGLGYRVILSRSKVLELLTTLGETDTCLESEVSDSEVQVLSAEVVDCEKEPAADEDFKTNTEISNAAHDDYEKLRRQLVTGPYQKRAIQEVVKFCTNNGNWTPEELSLWMLRTIIRFLAATPEERYRIFQHVAKNISQ